MERSQFKVKGRPASMLIMSCQGQRGLSEGYQTPKHNGNSYRGGGGVAQGLGGLGGGISGGDDLVGKFLL